MVRRWLKGGSRGARRLAILVALAAPAALALALSATAAPTVAEPTIVEQPANPTNATSAHFAYRDSQAGATFQCQLDSAGYSPCPAAGVTYSGPLAPGAHTFKVQAVSGGKTSAAASYRWTIATTPPTMSLTFPTEGGTYAASAWTTHCSGGVICGKAKDPQGVTSVVLSIRQGSGDWWSGSAFNSTSETFLPTALSEPGASTTEWGYNLPLPHDGSYTVHVRASDAAGNTTPAASQLIATFTVKATPPPTPSISSGPEEETNAKVASFAFADSAAGVSYLCAKDEGAFTACTSPKSYESVTFGEHAFHVEAKDAAGNVSAPASYSWTVLKGFVITGNLSGVLSPGVSRPLLLRVENPNGRKMYLTSLHVSVQAESTRQGCAGPANLAVTQSNASELNAVAVPAKGQITLPAAGVSAPQVLMRDLSSNQDACKGATFAFLYTGTGHS